LTRKLTFAGLISIALLLFTGAVTLVDLTTQVTGILPVANGGTGTNAYVPFSSGMIAFISSGSCPTGWTEQTFAGDYPLFTVAANADAGTTGGSTSYTPAGTLNSVSAGTPAGTNGTTSAAATGTKFTTSSSGTPALTALAGTTIASGANTVTLAAPAFTGSALAGHTHTFTGTAATIQPPFVKLIACKKN
jgi:hypothetical protein